MVQELFIWQSKVAQYAVAQKLVLVNRKQDCFGVRAHEKGIIVPD